MNMTGRALEFRVKAGSTTELIIDIIAYDGTNKDLSDTTKYATAYFKVWKPDGTLIINSQATFFDRPNGQISYTLQTADTNITKAGVWEGEVEIRNSTNVITDQSETFNFIIEESY